MMFHQLWFVMQHHKRVSNGTPSHSEVCFQLGLTYAAQTYNGTPRWPGTTGPRGARGQRDPGVAGDNLKPILLMIASLTSYH